MARSAKKPDKSASGVKPKTGGRASGRAAKKVHLDGTVLGGDRLEQIRKEMEADEKVVEARRRKANNGLKINRKVTCGANGGVKADGKPCGMPPLKGREDGRCINHPANGEDLRSQFPGTNGSASDKPRKTATFQQRFAARLEENLDQVMEVYYDALGAEKGIAVSGGRDGAGYVEYVDDHPTRLKAANDLIDRVHGKAKESMVLSGPDDGPIEVTIPKTKHRAADVAAILQKAGALGGATTGPPKHEGRSRRTPGQVGDAGAIRDQERPTGANARNGSPSNGNGNGSR